MGRYCETDGCSKRAYYGYEYKVPIACPEHRIKQKMVNVVDPRCIKCKETRPSYGLKGQSATHCSECATSDMINVVSKKCVECKETIPSYGLVKKKPTHCVTCATPEMFNVTAKLCIVCDKTIAHYGIIGGPPTHCIKCSTEDMINIYGYFCIVCKITQASYGLEGQTLPSHCAKCAEDNMKNIITKMCVVCNIKHPSFGISNGKATHCGTCREENMENLKAILCITCHTVQASYGYEKWKALYCIKCKPDDANDVRSDMCEICNEKQASFANEGDKASRCFDCKTNDMENVSNKKCINCNGVTPSFNYEGLFAEYCYTCKTEDMIDVTCKRCINNCSNRIRSNSKYGEYCLRCYINMFPDNIITKNYKTKEVAVVNFIKENFSEYKWIWDKRVFGGSSLRRPDLFLELENQIIIIEVDENQHRKYDCSCDNKRLMEISLDVKHKSIVFIRFNPDSYYDKNNNKILSPWKEHKKTGILCVKKEDINEWNKRLENLKNLVIYWLNNNTDKIIEPIEIYYDENL
jgi:hypothetical protein